ncbi:expressed unknown protein [Seminavis robusta]|uniref:Uncharacterized protein n=1 Tax=Seminavis robusta TaxID=568900 RepID=A0A9N8F2G7_9STRA|nr:expressed unknown protein [Seminavis robusta]|eukprot:Sro3575_g349290.1 n/a (467) ;mRNA; r:4233-5633
MSEEENDREMYLSEDQSDAVTASTPVAVNAKKITLHFDEGSDLASISSSLKDPDCVVLYVNLYASFMQKYGPEAIEQLFSEVHLPHLLGIKVWRPECRVEEGAVMPQFSFPVKALSLLLRSTLKLEYLIFDLKLAGNRDDFAGLGNAFGRLVMLQCIGLTINVDDKVNQDTGGTANPLDPLIKGLAKLSNVTDIIIKGSCNPMEDSLGALESAGLRDLCLLPKLSSLYLFLFVLSNDNLAAMASSLEHNNVLRELCINCSLGITGSQAFTRLFRRNQTLNEVIMIVTGFDQADGNPNNNHSIQHQIEAEIAEGLADSTSLKEFLFQGGMGEMSTQSLTHFRDAVKSNYVIEKVSLRVGDDHANKALDEEMKFLMELNKLGRGELLTDTTVHRDARWTRMLAKMGSDISNLHYLLSMNPSLCCYSVDSSSPQRSRGKKKAASTATQSQPTKRTRLYRAAKYQRVNYR